MRVSINLIDLLNQVMPNLGGDRDYLIYVLDLKGYNANEIETLLNTKIKFDNLD